MYDHIGLKVKDLDAAVRFYRAALEPLGYGLCSQDASCAGFGPAGAPALWLYPAAKATAAATHVAFRAPDRPAVDSLNAPSPKAASRDHQKPGLRANSTPTYYAAFLVT